MLHWWGNECVHKSYYLDLVFGFGFGHSKMFRILSHFFKLRSRFYVVGFVLCILITIAVYTYPFLHSLTLNRLNRSFRLFPAGRGNRTRILCLILTSDANPNKMIAVNNTWAKRCDHHLFIYGKDSKAQNNKFILKTAAEEGRSHLTSKVRLAFQHAYRKYNKSFDWIMKCDDDTYVIMENLKFLLSQYDPDKPGYMGFHMKTTSTRQSGYMSGGAGYVISSRALRNLVEIGFKQDGACRQDGGNEDEEMGICLAKSNVSVVPSMDSTGKETFYAENIKSFVSPLEKLNIAWLNTYAWNKPLLFGTQYPATFHYVSATEHYLFEHLLYNTRVHTEPRTIHNSDHYIDSISPNT